MQYAAPVLFSLVIASLVLVSGCTHGTAPPVTATPLQVDAGDLKAMAISPSDLPSCFSLSAEQVKTYDDVGLLARDLGWQAGYAVTFTCPAEGNGEQTVILHSLAVYPAVNVYAVVTMVDSQDRSGAGYVFENLTFAGSEAEMRGFYGRTKSRDAGNASESPSLLTEGKTGSGSISQYDMAEIIISRGTTFEVLKMTGPKTNATLLEELARTALARVA